MSKMPEVALATAGKLRSHRIFKSSPCRSARSDVLAPGGGFPATAAWPVWSCSRFMYCATEKYATAAEMAIENAEMCAADHHLLREAGLGFAAGAESSSRTEAAQERERQEPVPRRRRIWHAGFTLDQNADIKRKLAPTGKAHKRSVVEKEGIGPWTFSAMLHEQDYRSGFGKERHGRPGSSVSSRSVSPNPVETHRWDRALSLTAWRIFSITKASRV